MNNIFRQRLQNLREKKRISRTVLSQLCGLAPDAVRRYERGESEPSMESLISIADFFEVSTDYLLGRSE
jgi:transcriptional regulator with XRE-family HTH domain